MRIVDRKVFLKLPGGTLFYNYEPMVFGEMSIKGDTCGGDFTRLDLNDVVDARDTGEMVDLLEDGAKSGSEIPTAFDNWGRDAMFEEGQLFAVLSKDEARSVAALIARECAG